MNDTVSLGNILTMVTTLIGVFGLVIALRRDKRDQLEQAKSRTKEVTDKIDENQRGMDERVRALELQATAFWPKSEIQAAIEHQRNNRLTAEDGIDRRLTGVATSVHNLEIQVGKIEERHDNIVASLVKVETLVEKLGTKMDAGFEKLADQRRVA